VVPLDGVSSSRGKKSGESFIGNESKNSPRLNTAASLPPLVHPVTIAAVQQSIPTVQTSSLPLASTNLSISNPQLISTVPVPTPNVINTAPPVMDLPFLDTKKLDIMSNSNISNEAKLLKQRLVL